MRLFMALFIALPLLLVACDSDDDSDSTIEPDASQVTQMAETPSDASSSLDDDLEEQLGSVDGVRGLLGSASDLDPNMIEDVDFDNQTLRIQLNQDDSFAESNDVESICSDVNDAIGFADLEVVIESSSGMQLAQCSFTG